MLRLGSTKSTIYFSYLVKLLLFSVLFCIWMAGIVVCALVDVANEQSDEPTQVPNTALGVLTAPLLQRVRCRPLTGVVTEPAAVLDEDTREPDVYGIGRWEGDHVYSGDAIPVEAQTRTIFLHNRLDSKMLQEKKTSFFVSKSSDSPTPLRSSNL